MSTHEMMNSEAKLIPLSKLAQRINHECAAINRTAIEMLRHILLCGDYLNQAKRQIPYGGFTQWLETNCDLHHAQAHRYMRIATMFPKLHASKQKRASELKSFRQILALVTGLEVDKKSEPESKQESGRRSAGGETPIRSAAQPVKRPGDCSHRGCVRPASMMGCCSQHFMEDLITNLRYVSREELEQLFDFLNQSLSDHKE